VGNWQITASCLTLKGTLADSQCPTATIDSTVHFTGSASYTSALTYTLVTVLNGTETIFFPASCLSGATCDQINQTFQATPPAGTTSVQCGSAGGGACNCTATLAPDSSTETGTYTTSAGIVTSMSSAGGTPGQDGYCVQGATLHIIPGSGMIDPSFTSTGDITLAKQ